MSELPETNVSAGEETADGKRKVSRLHIAAIVLLLIEAASMVSLIVYILGKAVLPFNFISAGVCICAVIILVELFILFLVKKGEKARHIVCMVLSAFFAFICLFILLFLVRTYGSLSKMLEENQISFVNTVNVYTLKDKRAEDIKDLKGASFGVLELLDRGSTDIALARISDTVGSITEVKEVGGILTAAKLLADEEVDAILLNEGLHETLTDNLPGFDLWADVTGTVDVTRKTINKKKPALAETAMPKEAGEGKNEEDEIKPFVIYISGLDNRGVSSVPEIGNSDVNMLAAINPGTRKILLVSVPRDYYYYLWGDKNYPDKLTHSGYYGADCGMKTLSSLFGIEIKYYVKVCFSSVINIVDALGGITVDSEHDFSIADCSFHVGKNDLSGYEALQFARVRKTLPGGDRARVRNQQIVVNGIIDKMTSPAIIRRFGDVLDAITSNTRTNISMDFINRMVKLQLENMISWDVETYQVDGAGDWQYCYSLGSANDVMIPYQDTVDTAKSMINDILYKKAGKQ